jgi:HSP20 family molecular chaperone IbpA
MSGAECFGSDTRMPKTQIAWDPTTTTLALTEEVLQMSRISMFNSPLLLGFDQIERVLDQVSKTKAEGYPPYNIEQFGENKLRITVAVAGFAEEDLSVTTEDNQLIIRGKHTDDDSERVYIHRGIASRQFQRSFVLAEGIEVVGAHLDNGLLHVDLNRPLPEPVVREIAIGSNKKKAVPSKTIDMNVEEEDSAADHKDGKA